MSELLNKQDPIKVITSLDDDVVYDGVNPYSTKGAETFKKYCEDNSIYYYAAPHCIFDRKEAITEAVSRGYKTVYLDNLS